MKKTLALIMVLAMIGIAWAQDASNQRMNHYNISKSKLAIKGYDPVSYHNGEAMKGSDQITATLEGLQYRFSSEANRAAFQADPAKFEPAYGGWCAWAMLVGDKVKINPKRFKIINGKTYLFYDGFLGNTLKKWNQKAEKTPEPELVQTADGHWETILK